MRIFTDAFRHSISLAFTVFGDVAFRKFSVGGKSNPNGSWERSINRPLYDIVMWGFTRFEKNQIIPHASEIRNAVIELTTKDMIFIDSITSATGDKTKTQFRFELWHETLKEIVSTAPQRRTFSSETKRQLFATSNVCGICGQPIQHIDDAHVDHLTPFSKGGPTEISNAQIVHRFCNLSKSNK